MSDDTQASVAAEQADPASRALSGRQIGAAALLLAGSVLLSRVLGFVRDMVLAFRQGVGASTDAFSAAFQIPDILNYLLAGGALAIAFTPLYLATLRREGEEAGARLFHGVLGTLGIATVGLTLLLWVWADAAIALQFPHFDADTRALTVRLTRIVLPAQVFFVTGGIVRAVLMAHGRFGAQAAAPLLYNAGIIAGGLLGDGIEGFAWGALAGAFLGAWVVPVWQIRSVSRLSLRVDPFGAGFRAYLMAALPLMLGLSLTTVDEWYERWFGQALGVGVLASLAYARRLVMAPVAVVGQAVATAALPSLAALHSEGRDRDLDALMLRTLRGTLALAVVLAVALAVFSLPVVRVLYERGAFSPEDSLRVAGLLQILAFAVPGWVTQQVAVRAFFARGEMWRPMLLGSVLALAAIPLYRALGDAWGAAGIAAAGAFAISVNALATLVWGRVRYGGPGLGPLLDTACRAVVIALVAGFTAHLLAPVGAGFVGASTTLLVGGVVYGLAVLLLVRLVGDLETRAVLARLLARVRRSSDPPPSGSSPGGS